MRFFYVSMLQFLIIAGQVNSDCHDLVHFCFTYLTSSFLLLSYSCHVIIKVAICWWHAAVTSRVMCI